MLRSPLHKLARALPIFCWLSTYNSEIALADLIAGITVGLTLISQSIVYAALADLPPQYGLYSSLIGGFVYAVFGTVPALSIAPTAILSLLTFTYTSGVSFGTIEATSLLCFYSGIIEVCCGLLNLGFVADFISTPVVVGVTSAAAVLITLTQLISIFGLPEPINSSGSGKPGTRTFVGLWKHIFWNISNINTWDTALGIFCCCFLFILSRLQSQSLYKEREKTSPTFKRLKTFFWFLSISRNLLLILTSVGLAYILSSDDGSMFSLPVSDIRPNFPSISLPQFNIIKNNTTLSFLDMTKELGIGIFVIPFMAIVANAAIAKSFMQYNVLDGSQEMLALGICNIIGSCVGAMPVSGSFSRSAINQSSGVRSPVSGIYTGLIIVSSFIFLMPVFSYIPKAAISSVTVCALSVMLSLKLPKKIWELNKVDIETYQLISTPVVVGVTSAAAVLITLTQLISIFGLPEPGTRTFVGLWKHIFWNISNINTWDTALGIVCCCFLFILSRLQSSDDGSMFSLPVIVYFAKHLQNPFRPGALQAACTTENTALSRGIT
ncbi:Sulfate permease family [Popillia japonica]|uniref:Sulfate permease family n=1 Tax=Popillia japonica TaxID=7064 RepID=A0AAW1LTM0_POPJA